MSSHTMPLQHFSRQPPSQTGSPNLTSNLNTKPAPTTESTRLLDAFLRPPAPPTPIPTTHWTQPLASNPHSTRPLPTLQTLPLPLLQRILLPLLTSPHPLPLDRPQPPSKPPPSPSRPSTLPEISLLLLSRHIHTTAHLLLYTNNTFTTSSPSTSRHFATHLAALPGLTRQLIRSVKLEIAWAGELWAHFPLVAQALGELRGLRGLEIVILPTPRAGVTGVALPALAAAADEVGFEGRNGRVVRESSLVGRGGGEVMRGVGRGWVREGRLAEVMLRAERKMFRELVGGLRGLRRVRLRGFGDEGFARGLERWVGGKGGGGLD